MIGTIRLNGQTPVNLNIKGTEVYFSLRTFSKGYPKVISIKDEGFMIVGAEDDYNIYNYLVIDNVHS